MAKRIGLVIIGLFLTWGIYLCAGELEDKWQGVLDELLYVGQRAPGAGINTTDKECKLEHIQKLPKCLNCNILLKGYKCLNCSAKKCEKCIGHSYLFQKSELNNYKCPCCGSGNLSSAPLLNLEKCYKCGAKPQEVEVCVKNIYLCPAHKFMPSFRVRYNICKVLCSSGTTGTLKPCGQAVEKFTEDYAEVNYAYQCPKCKKEYIQPGKCDEIGCKEMALKTIRKCPKSGTFPHVYENKWEIAISNIQFLEDGTRKRRPDVDR